MAKLILVRHGETELNKKKVFFGHLDSSLTELGEKQVFNLKNKLEDYDYIISSPLQRTVKTSDIINYKNLPIIFDERLKELNFGIFEGLNYSEICKTYPEKSEKWNELGTKYKFEEGESVEELSVRVKAFVEEIKTTDNTYLIVTHFGVINSILSIYIAENINNFWKFKSELASITTIEFSENFPILKNFSLL